MTWPGASDKGGLRAVDGAETMKVAIIAPEKMVEMVGAAVNPFLTVVMTLSSGGGALITITRWGDHVHPRAMAGCSYLTDLHRISMSRPPITPWRGEPVVLQMEDNPVPIPSCAFESREGWHQVRLVPDIYYYESGGHRDFAPVPMAWENRRRGGVWRGSTSGLVDLTVDRLAQLPRYQLCRMARELALPLDCRFTNIAQATTEDERMAIERSLLAAGLMGDYIDLPAMNSYRLLIDIDGNANAWNIVAKLRLGCCLLKVESPWHQWIYDRLEPWRHYIPVRYDLKDLAERVAWCMANDGEAKAIANRGQELSEGVHFDDEIAAAAALVFGDRAQ